ncbi:MAG TPA: Sua5/YciO/YrdC/YwlC family protein [Tepidisphaeraceae bacterium]|jgi:protein-tyrosine phosphatase|nr:Sua5/YciO/YrdC/YwlC family protein [Tepidisphaeraceae bacterium]
MPVPVIPILDVRDYEAEVRRGVQTLTSGGLVVLPTETVYGAAGRLDIAEARAKLAALRGEASAGKPFTIHLAKREDAMQYLGEVSELGRRMMKKLWPGPVGLWFDVPADRRAEAAKALNLNEADLYDGGGIVLRCPDDNIATDVIGEAGGPIVLTAVGGAALRADGLATELDGKVDLIFDAGHTRYNKPSTLLRVNGSRYEIVRQGVYDERIIEKMLKTTILFVCSGNTCRSPMAEALARSILVKKLGGEDMALEKRGISIISAGSFAMAGARATPQAVEAVKGLGGDLSGHRSRALTVELIHQADAIFTMGRAHAGAVLSLVPSARDKVTTLDPSGDIEDPIGGDQALYTSLAGSLKGIIEKRLDELNIS